LNISNWVNQMGDSTLQQRFKDYALQEASMRICNATQVGMRNVLNKIPICPNTHDKTRDKGRRKEEAQPGE